MTDLLSLHSLFLFLLCLGEMCCYEYFLKDLDSRFGHAADIALILISSAVLFAITKPFVRYIYEFAFLCASFLTIWLFMIIKTKISVRESLFYLLLFILITPFFKHAIGHFSISSYQLNYMVEGENWFLRGFYLLALLTSYLAVFSLIRRHAFQGGKENLTYKQLLWMLCAVAPVILVNNFVSVSVRIHSQDVGWQPIIIEGICVICGLMIVIGIENMLTLRRKEKELLMMEALFKSQYQQYLVKKEAIEQVNMKYHDMKNHLLLLSKMTENDGQTDYIKSLIKEISDYEAVFQSGNAILDVLFTEKQRICLQEGIRLFLLVDGRAFSFLNPSDTTVIFANAFDNAIESVRHVVDADRREITVKSSKTENWLILRFENYFSHELIWNDDNLSTTKRDAESHGIGLKSIKYTVSKYNGNMTVDAKDGRFVLNVLLPLQSEC